MKDIGEVVAKMIQAGEVNEAIELARKPKDHREGEEIVVAVLKEELSTPELVETALASFFDTRLTLIVPRKDCWGNLRGHGSWVHSVSHFTNVLWKKGMYEWVKKFNEASFKGANELGDNRCSERLVSDFGIFAKWDHDPADFHITLENIPWMDWKSCDYAKLRIEAGRFASEEAFLRWRLQNAAVTMWVPDREIMLVYVDYDIGVTLINSDVVRATIARLQAVGGDASEFGSIERDLLTKQLAQLEEKLPSANSDRLRVALEDEIRGTRAALEGARQYQRRGFRV